MRVRRAEVLNTIFQIRAMITDNRTRNARLLRGFFQLLPDYFAVGGFYRQ